MSDRFQAGALAPLLTRFVWPLGFAAKTFGALALFCAAGLASAGPVEGSIYKAGALSAQALSASDAAAMGWPTEMASKMNAPQTARLWAERLSRHRNLPAAVLVSGQTPEGEGASANARVEPGSGECRVVIPQGSMSSRGLDFDRAGLTAGPRAQESAMEQEILHELGHCRQAARAARFEHPALSARENEALASSLFSLEATRFEQTGAAAGLFAEAHADAYMAIKWMEGQAFSERSKAALRAMALSRQAEREDWVSHRGGRLTLATHLSEDAIALALSRADEIMVMSPERREKEAALIGSQAAVRMLERSEDGVSLSREALFGRAWGQELAQIAVADMADGRDEKAAPAYKALDPAGALGQALERVSRVAIVAARDAGKSAGVVWSRGAQGMSEAQAERVIQALLKDERLVQAVAKESALSGSVSAETAWGGLRKARRYEARVMPALQSELSALRQADLVAEPQLSKKAPK